MGLRPRRAVGRRRIATGAICAALLLISCSVRATSEEAASAARAFLDAVASGDSDAGWDMLTPATFRSRAAVRSPTLVSPAIGHQQLRQGPEVVQLDVGVEPAQGRGHRARPAARGRIQGCWLVIWLLDQPRHRPDLPTLSDLLLAAQTAASPRAAQVSPDVRLEPIRVSRGWNGVLSVSLGIWWHHPLP